MSLYVAHIYTRIVRLFGNPTPIQDLRRRLLPLAEGVVLEIGFGPGVNLSYYDEGKVRKLYALEPNEGMLRIARRHPRLSRFDHEFLGLRGEQIPLPDQSVDTVVSTFTLCTLDGIAEALDGIVRVLKPGGRLLFIENTVSADPAVRRWQDAWRPVHRRVFAGLDLTRDVRAHIASAGFTFEADETMYLAAFPKSWTCCCWGSAIITSPGAAFRTP